MERIIIIAFVWGVFAFTVWLLVHSFTRPITTKLGWYIRTRDISNPFRDNSHDINVVEVKNGWARYHFKHNPTLFYSMSVSDINLLYTFMESNHA